MRIGDPPTLIAASLASTTLPVRGPSTPPEVTALTPDSSPAEARELATQYATGLATGYATDPRLSPPVGSVDAAPQDETELLAIQESIRTAAAHMKHPLSALGGLVLIGATIGGIALRRAGMEWDKDVVERIGQTVSDVSGFAATLLGPGCKPGDAVIGAMVVGLDLYGAARHGGKQDLDNAANLLQWAENFAVHPETAARSIARAVPQLSLDPLVIPDP